MDKFSKFKKIAIDSLLPIFAGVALISGIIYAWNEPSTAPPSGSGAISISQGNVGIGTETPNSTKGTSGYIDVKDVFLRDKNRWASDVGDCLCRINSNLSIERSCGSAWQYIYYSGGTPIAYFRCSNVPGAFGPYLAYGAHTESDCTGTAVLQTSDVDTRLLIHADEASGSSVLADSSGFNTITVSGNVKTSNLNQKFGNNLHFPGGTNDYIALADNEHWTWDQDYTIDLWLRPTKIDGYFETIMSTYYDNYNLAFILGFYYTTGRLAWWDNLLDSWVDTGVSLALNQWQHIAVVRRGYVNIIFLNGHIISAWTFNYGSTGINATQNQKLYIGRRFYPSYVEYQGYMDEIRISKGVARWVSDFTPPGSPYSVTTSQSYGTVQTDGTNKFCKFDSSYIPPGWTLYNNWLAASTKTCTTLTNHTTNCPAQSCIANGQSFSNNPASACWYTPSRWWGLNCSEEGVSYNCCLDCPQRLCVADITSVGCY
jgi:hypothetical protein